MEPATSNLWVMDLGASRHITFDKQKLQHFKSLQSEVVVTFGNNQSAKAMGTGDVWIKT